MVEPLTEEVLAIVQQGSSSDHEESESHRDDVLSAALRVLIWQDEYGRISHFGMKATDTVKHLVDGVDGAIITLCQSDIRDRISDECGELFYSAGKYSFLYSFDRRVDRNGILAEDGSLVAAARGAGEEDEAEIWVPSPAVSGEDFVQWAAKNVDDELSLTERLEKFDHLCSSAEWLVSRVIRGEPVFAIGDEWSALRIIERPDVLFHASYFRRKPAFYVRLNLIPDATRAIPSGTREWPEFEIDLLTSEDHFVLLERTYSGKWRSSRSNAICRMAELTDEHKLALTDRRGVKTQWPTNLYRRRVKNKELAAIWSPDWRSSCGYEIEVAEEYKLDLSK